MGDSKKRTLRVAAIQMVCRDGRFQENLQRARSFIQEAAAGGAKVVLLPELFRSGDFLYFS